MNEAAHAATEQALAGLVERVTYHNEETGFSVLRVAVRGHRDVATIVGHAAAIAAGEWITASGEWVTITPEGFFTASAKGAGWCARRRRGSI